MFIPFSADKLELPIDHEPGLAAALGRLLVHWAFLEKLLINILKYLLYLDWHTASYIYQEFVSLRGKVNLLRRLNHICTHNEPFKQEIDDILTQVLELNLKRNAFVHSYWHSEFEEIFFREKTMLPHNHKISEHPIEEFTLDEVENVVEEIAKLSQSLRRLLFQTIEGQITPP